MGSVADLGFFSCPSPPFSLFTVQKTGWAVGTLCPVCLLCSHTTTVLTTLLTFLVTKWVVIFPHQAILCDTCWVFYSLSQFWNYLPGHSFILHRIRAECHEIALLLQKPIASRSLVTHNCWLTQLQIRGFHDFLLLGFDYLLEQLTELRETLTCICQFIKAY